MLKKEIGRGRTRDKPAVVRKPLVPIAKTSLRFAPY
jgi:hypothetical protein